MRKPQENMTRREVLKKAGIRAAFVAPVLLSYRIEELKAQASGMRPPPAPPG
jgi:hypothetical protein